jgi:hypothetical protein
MEELDYQNERLSEKLIEVKKRAAKLSVFRLVTFFGLGALLILGLAEHALWLIPAGGAAWGFVFLIKKFNLAKDQEAIYLALEEINRRRTARQERSLGDLDEGSAFADKSHPFAGDLDLFGAHSLFQLLNHCTSKGGQKKLAALLKSDFSPKEAQARAAGVAELRDKIDFLQSMEAVGLAFQQDRKGPQNWNKWLESQEKFSVGYLILAMLGPLGGLALLVLIWFGVIPQALLGLWILAGILVLAGVFMPLKRAAEAIPLASELKSFYLRAQLVEEVQVGSEVLSQEKASFFSEEKPVSTQLRELDQMGLWLQSRMNILYFPINLLFWTDFLLYVRLVRWKAKVGDSLLLLFENLESWEVWVSLGSFESEVGYPGVSTWSDQVELQAVNAAHPLIHPKKAIGNSITLDDKQRLILLTGANMSGKTTFMRTLGINAVLMNLGLRPFADQFALGPVQLFTSMRNSDNLGESVSSFYAELHRIRTLIRRLESGEQVFFLLDEILKGTNTQDRISGSEALIRQVLKTHGFGMISTHDVELSALEGSVEQVSNFSFHSAIQDQTIEFDYLIKKGPCPSFNAHKLMELMGIRFGPKG